jgi:hypothetical protein
LRQINRRWEKARQSCFEMKASKPENKIDSNYSTRLDLKNIEMTRFQFSGKRKGQERSFWIFEAPPSSRSVWILSHVHDAQNVSISLDFLDGSSRNIPACLAEQQTSRRATRIRLALCVLMQGGRTRSSGGY